MVVGLSPQEHAYSKKLHASGQLGDNHDKDPFLNGYRYPCPTFSKVER